MHDILIITGTCGVGKSTISRTWAERRLGATIDCDVFRGWIRNPVLITADGFQEMLLARHAAALAEDYVRMGMDVAIDNVWTPAGLAYLQDHLENKGRVRVVWLNSASTENHRRDEERPPSDVMGDRVDELQGELDGLDWPETVVRLDTTGQTVEETIDGIERLFGPGATKILNGLTLRASTPADAEFIYAVTRETMTAYAVQAYGLNEDELDKACRGDICIGQDQVVVLHGREIGVLSVEHSEGELFIDKLLILPDYQRWGIGTNLTRVVLDEAFRKGLPVKLHVLKVNPAQRLYERLGFVQTGQTDAYYEMAATPPE